MLLWLTLVGRLPSMQKVMGSIPASANSPIFSVGVFAVRELINVVLV